MKKITYLLLMILVVLPVFSQKEEYDKAKFVAEQFLSQKNVVALKNDTPSRRKAARQNHSLDLTYEVQEASKSLVYVFSSEEQSEFAIVVADKSEPIVVGYSTNQAFDKDNIIPPVKAFMDAYAKMAKEGNAISKVAAAEKASIWPLVKTKWSQSMPYNQDCPDRSVVGCSPLAMGQIMKYYEYPIHGIGEHGGINFAEQTYDFKYMLCGHMPGPGAREVAKLLYHAGVAADTEYSGPDGSGTDPLKIVSAMKQYFGFSESAEMKMRSGISDSDWDAMVYNELAKKHPLIYGGYSSSYEDGHDFIVDGYNDGFYHVNWGWGGKQDGYFLLSALQDYNYAQMASFGLAPDGWTPVEESESDLLTIGFCDNSIAVFAYYSDDGEEGARSCIPYSHIIPYVGKKIIGVQIGLAEDVTGLKVMLKPSLTEDPFYTQEVSSAHVGWNTILFDIPQTIPANDIYYSYSFDPKPGSHPVGKTPDNPGRAMYQRDGVDEDIKQTSFWYWWTDGDNGALSFRLILAEDTEMPADLRLLQMEPVRVLSDSHLKMTGIVENTSGCGINNYTLKYRIDDLPTETLFMNQPLKKNERAFFSFEIYKEQNLGEHELRVWVAEVDGQPDAVMANSNYYNTNPLLFKTLGGNTFPRTHVVNAEVDVYCGFSSVYEITQEEVEQSGQYDCIFINHHIQNMGPDPMANCIGSHGGGSTPDVYINGIYQDYTQLANLISTYEPTSLAKIEGKASFATDRKQIIVNTKTQFAYKGKDNYRIQYLLVEENVGPFEVIGDKIFKHVTRGIYNTSIGVISTPFNPNQPQECNFAIPLADNIQNYKNLHVVAMLINDKTNEVVNAVKMSVTDEEVHCFTLDKTNLSLLCDVVEKLNVIDSEVSNANAEDYIFMSSDENIVKVLEGGYIRAIGAGFATVTCKQKNGTNSTHCKVTVRDWENEVTVTTPGTLRDMVGLFDYSELKINGNLDAMDMRYIRALTGLSDDFGNDKNGFVRRLNLKNAKLVRDDRPVVKVGIIPSQMEDVLCEYALSGTLLTTLIVPSSLKVIDRYALASPYLRYVTLNEGLEKINGCVFTDTKINSIYFPSTFSSLGNAFYYSSFDYCWVNNMNPYYFAYNNDVYTKDTKSLVLYNNSGRYALILPDWCTGVESGLTYQEFGTLGLRGRGLTEVKGKLITREWRKVEFGPCLERVDGQFAVLAQQLKEIVMPPLNPPTVDGEFSIGIDPQQCALYVNPESIELYKVHPIWRKFFIQPMTEEMLQEMQPYYTGIKEVRNVIIESNKVYDLSGRQITQGSNQRKAVLIKGGKKFIKR